MWSFIDKVINWREKPTRPGHQENLSTEKPENAENISLTDAEAAFKKVDRKIAEEARQKAEAERLINLREKHGIPAPSEYEENPFDLPLSTDPEVRKEKMKIYAEKTKIEQDPIRRALEAEYPPGSKIFYKTAKGNWINVEVIGASFDKVPGLILLQDNGKSFAVNGELLESRVSKDTPPVEESKTKEDNGDGGSSMREAA